MAGHRLSLTHWALVAGPCWHGCQAMVLAHPTVSTVLGFYTCLEAEGGGEGRHGTRKGYE